MVIGAEMIHHGSWCEASLACLQPGFICNHKLITQYQIRFLQQHSSHEPEDAWKLVVFTQAYNMHLPYHVPCTQMGYWHLTSNALRTVLMKQLFKNKEPSGSCCEHF